MALVHDIGTFIIQKKENQVSLVYILAYSRIRESPQKESQLLTQFNTGYANVFDHGTLSMRDAY